MAPYDSIITFVGGQLIDTVKVVSDKLNIFLINIQTLPSNCAALTSKSIIYASSTHEKVANKRQQKPVDMVLIEPELLRRAPKAYIVSGIGDTLAKYYEIRRRLTLDKTIHVTAAIGRFYIETCRKITLSLEDFNEISDIEWHNALDTIFLVAASVDGIAKTSGLFLNYPHNPTGLDTEKSRALMDLYETSDTFDTAFSDPNQALINALINGFSAHAEDIDDTHANLRGHPSAVIFPALLAVSDVDDRMIDVLKAYVIGLEFAGRLGLQAQPQHASKGYHSSGTLGSLGAAVAIGIFKGLDEEYFLT